MIALIALRDGVDADGSPETVPPVAATASPASDAPVLAVETANVRALPDTAAEVLAVLSSGQQAEPIARTDGGDWVRVAVPPGSAGRGWVLAASLDLRADRLAALPVAATMALPAPAADSTPSADALPDLVISDVFLLQDGRLEVRISNAGAGTLRERRIPLHISRASGETIGVLLTGPVTLEPGRVATVVTPVVVSRTGSYLLEVDRPDEIAESEEFNNIFSALLVAESQQ